MSLDLDSVVNAIAQTPMLVRVSILCFCVVIEYILPIFPGDTIVLMAGFLRAKDALGLLEISVAIVIGSLIGASIAYFIGRYFLRHEDNYRWSQKLAASKSFASFSVWYQKWGALLIAINRFFPGIRALFFVMAGFAQISFRFVLFFGLLSALLFNGALIVLGEALGRNFEQLIYYFHTYNKVLLILMVAAAVITALVYLKRRTK